MLAGLDLAFDVSSDDDPGDQPLVQNIVVMGMPINVENNCSRGILTSGEGDVFLNVIRRPISPCHRLKSMFPVTETLTMSAASTRKMVPLTFPKMIVAEAASGL